MKRDSGTISEARGGSAGEVDLAGSAMRMGADGRPVLIGGSCAQCGTRTFPAYAVCPMCASEDVHEEAMPRRGLVYSFSIVHAGAQSWRKPFTVGYVDLVNAVRLFAHLRGAVAIGTEVELGRGVIGVEPGGASIVSFIFEAAS